MLATIHIRSALTGCNVECWGIVPYSFHAPIVRSAVLRHQWRHNLFSQDPLNLTFTWLIFLILYKLHLLYDIYYTYTHLSFFPNLLLFPCLSVVFLGWFHILISLVNCVCWTIDYLYFKCSSYLPILCISESWRLKKQPFVLILPNTVVQISHFCCLHYCPCFFYQEHKSKTKQITLF